MSCPATASNSRNATDDAARSTPTASKTPESVTVRLLLPDMSQPLAVPSRAASKPGDAPAVRERVAEIARPSAGPIIESIRELGELGLVQKVDVRARVIPLPMMFKMYLLNDEEVFFGFYPVAERDVKIGTKNVPIFDAVGKDTCALPSLGERRRPRHRIAVRRPSTSLV